MSSIIPEMHAGQPLRYNALSVFPLFLTQTSRIPYRLAAEAIVDDSLVVEEVSEAGSVPELLVRNSGQQPVLFLEGEELVGAKQNRILNTTVLVASNSTVRIPVSCVEQGRWEYHSRQFGSSGSHSPASLRSTLKKSMSSSTQVGRGHRSDQHAVWQQVETYLAAHNVSSPSSAMSDLFIAKEQKLSHYQENLGYVSGASGLAFAIGRDLVGLDAFDSPATCEKVWHRLLSGCVLDAMAREEDGNEVETTQVEDLLTLLAAATWDQVQPVGEGQEYRTEFQGYMASTLCFQDTLLHASLAAGV